jgi:hypothetical protein
VAPPRYLRDSDVLSVTGSATDSASVTLVLNILMRTREASRFSHYGFRSSRRLVKNELELSGFVYHVFFDNGRR